MRIALLISLCFLVLTVTAWSSSPAAETWEYKIEYKISEKKANELGAQGWELAAIESPSAAGIGNNVPTYVFKRSK